MTTRTTFRTEEYTSPASRADAGQERRDAARADRAEAYQRRNDELSNGWRGAAECAAECDRLAAERKRSRDNRADAREARNAAWHANVEDIANGWRNPK